MESTTWTFDGYWNTVIGASRTPESTVREFGLTPGIDEWLGTAEAEAWAAGGLGGDLPEEWSGHHTVALAKLEAAAAAQLAELERLATDAGDAAARVHLDELVEETAAAHDRQAHRATIDALSWDAAKELVRDAGVCSDDPGIRRPVAAAWEAAYWAAWDAPGAQAEIERLAAGAPSDDDDDCDGSCLPVEEDDDSRRRYVVVVASGEPRHPWSHHSTWHCAQCARDQAAMVQGEVRYP